MRVHELRLGHRVLPSIRVDEINSMIASMKRKYGAQLAFESIAEKLMREAAKKAGDNSFNFGTKARKGSPFRGKRRK